MTAFWTQVAPNAYGSGSISVLQSFNNKLYGFSSDPGPTNGGCLIEWNDVNAWVEKAPQLSGQTNGLSLHVHNSELYGGTGLDGYLFKWNGTNAWIQLTTAFKYILPGLVSLGSYLYSVGYSNGVSWGCYLLQFDGISSWVAKASIGGADYRPSDLLVFGGKIYASTSTNGKLLEWDGISAWVEKAAQFGSERVNGMVVFGSNLYATTNLVTGNHGYLLKWNNVNAWVQVAAPPTGFSSVVSPIVYDNKLYAVASSSTAKLLRWNNVNAWDIITDTSPYPQRLAVFNGKIYAGKWGMTALLRLDGLPNDPDRIYVWIGTAAAPESIELTVPTYPTVLGVRTERGKDDELGYAQAGIADIICDNVAGDFNPDKAAGPYYGVLKLGCAVTVYERYLGVRYDHFRGRLDHIRAHTQPGNRLTYLTALDGMDDLAGVDVDTVLREDTASGVIVADVLAAAIPGGYTSAIDTGDPLNFAWVHKAKALDALRSIHDQEPQGFFYVSETGAYIWEGRIHRQQGVHLTSQATFDNSMLDYIYEVAKRQLWNHVRVRGSQYALAAAATLLWAASAGDESAPFIPAGATLDIWADLDAPVNSASVSTGGAGIHWNANASPTKSSTDLTADFSVVYTTYGQSVKFTITNNSAQDGYLVIPTSPPAGAPANATLLLYGKLYSDSVLTALKTNSTSIADFGSRAKEIECRYISSQKVIEQIGNLVLAKFKDPHPTPVGVRLNARTDESAGGNSTRIQCLTRKISDRITVKADLLTVNQDYFINKVIQDYKFLEGGIHHETEWLLEDLGPAALQKFWLLETVGYGELEQNTILG